MSWGKSRLQSAAGSATPPTTCLASAPLAPRELRLPLDKLPGPAKEIERDKFRTDVAAAPAAAYYVCRASETFASQPKAAQGAASFAQSRGRERRGVGYGQTLVAAALESRARGGAGGSDAADRCSQHFIALGELFARGAT